LRFSALAFSTCPLRIADLDAKILAVSLKGATGELGPVVGDDPIQDPKPADDGLDKFDCGLLIDLDHRGCFRPLGELVDGDVQIPESSDGYGEWTQDVQPHTTNNHEGRIICSVYASVWMHLA
jgi:hypothetical protein